MADFEYAPDYVFTQGVKFETLITRGGRGKEQRRSKGPAAGQISWTLQYSKLSATTADAIWSFYNSKKGALTSFTWLNPLDSQTYTVRFLEDNLTRNYFMFNRYNLTFTLLKVTA